MRELLKRFAETELDQWVTWRTETSWGPVYITIERSLPPGVSPETYDAF